VLLEIVEKLKKKKLSVPVWLLFATAWLRLKKYNVYLYLSWFGCNPNRQFSTTFSPYPPLWPQLHVTAQSPRCLAFPCQSLLVLLCTVLALARRKLLRRLSKQRSLCTCFVQLNPTISSFSLLFSQSIIVTSFK
jgi:hypothetical protein